MATAIIFASSTTPHSWYFEQRIFGTQGNNTFGDPGSHRVVGVAWVDSGRTLVSSGLLSPSMDGFPVTTGEKDTVSCLMLDSGFPAPSTKGPFH